LLNKSANTHVLQANRIQHPGRGLVYTGARSTGKGLPRETFGYKTSELVQIDQVSKLKTIAKGTAGSDDRIAKLKRAHGHAQVDIRGATAGK